MLLLAAGGIGIAALLTDWIAVRLGSAALAGLPLLLLFIEPFTLSIVAAASSAPPSRSRRGGRVPGPAVSSEGKDRISEWEHQDPSDRDAPDTRALAAAGTAGRVRLGRHRPVPAAADPRPARDPAVRRAAGDRRPPERGRRRRAAAPGGVGFPGVDTALSQQLNQELRSKPADVLVYTTTQNSPDYLQIYVLDQLTDSGWRLFGQPESLTHVGSALPAPPGLLNRAYAVKENETVTIAPDVGPDDLGALPVPYPALSVPAKGDLEADKSTLMLFDQGRLAGRAAVLGHQPVRFAARAGAQQRASAVRRHQRALPAGARRLRLAAAALAESVVNGAGREDPVREGRRAAELAGRRDVQVHAEGARPCSTRAA